MASSSSTSLFASLPPAPTLLRYLLTAQLVLGGQARLTSLFTPGANQLAMQKAPALHHHLGGYLFPLPIRVSGAEQHSRLTGAVMLGSGAMLCLPQTRLAGAVASGALLGSWAWAFWQMGTEWPVPVVNVVIAGVIAYGEWQK